MRTLRSAIPFFIAALLATAAWAADPAAGVDPLRGTFELDETAPPPPIRHWEEDRGVLPRDYVQQPPLIPHSIKGYKITINANKCLTCHSWANYRESGATKISQTHFSDREGNALANISARRYFCTQCHVPQVNAPPLIENEFQPVETLVEQQR